MEKRDTRVMMDLSGFKMDWIEKWCPLLTIAFACFVLHGMILLNERPFWDGLLIYHLERTGNWPELYRWFSECGIPSSALIHWAIGGWTSNPILAYRIVTFLSLLTISLSFYGICRFFGLSRGTGVQLAVLSLAIPVCQISEEVILSLNYLLIAVFFLSALWAFLALRKTGPVGRVLRGGSLAGFFLCFTIESLITFYLGFLLLYYGTLLRNREKADSPGIGFYVRTLLRNLDYGLIVVAYFALRLLYFQPYGSFRTYNRIHISLPSLLTNTWISLKNALFFHLDSAFSFYSPSQFILIMTLVAFLCDLLGSRIRWHHTEEGSTGRTLGLWGILFWFLGIAAYVIAQKPPHPVGLVSRCAVLQGVPTSLLLVGILHHWVRLPRYRGTLYALVLFAFSMVTWKSHLDWQGRTVKDLAILKALHRTPPPPDVTLFRVEDTMPMFSRRGDRVFTVYYDEALYFEWAALFYEVNPDKIRFGMPAALDDTEYRKFLTARRTNPQYGFADWQPGGNVWKMKILYNAPEWGSETLTEWDPSRIGLRFLILKLTRPRQRQERFLDQVLRIEFQP
jgi:hypothetical protein